MFLMELQIYQTILNEIFKSQSSEPSFVKTVLKSVCCNSQPFLK